MTAKVFSIPMHQMVILHSVAAAGVDVIAMFNADMIGYAPEVQGLHAR